MNIAIVVDFDIEPISVSINVRNGVTGSLGDPATGRESKGDMTVICDTQ